MARKSTPKILPKNLLDNKSRTKRNLKSDLPKKSVVIVSMLDFDGDETLTFEELKQGIFRLHGSAKSIDMATLLVSNNNLNRTP